MDCAQPAPRKALGEYQIEEQVRAALSHQFPDRGFDQVVREVFKLVLERDCKRKALTERPRAPWERPSENDRYVPDAVKRAVWERDQGRCTWPMGMGSSATRRTASSSTMIIAPPVKRSIVVAVSPRRRFRPVTGHKPSL